MCLFVLFIFTKFILVKNQGFKSQNISLLKSPQDGVSSFCLHLGVTIPDRTGMSRNNQSKDNRIRDRLNQII